MHNALVVLDHHEVLAGLRLLYRLFDRRGQHLGGSATDRDCGLTQVEEMIVIVFAGNEDPLGVNIQLNLLLSLVILNHVVDIEIKKTPFTVVLHLLHPRQRLL